jgi:hypothetical protein
VPTALAALAGWLRASQPGLPRAAGLLALATDCGRLFRLLAGNRSWSEHPELARAAARHTALFERAQQPQGPGRPGARRP